MCGREKKREKKAGGGLPLQLPSDECNTRKNVCSQHENVECVHACMHVQGRGCGSRSRSKAAASEMKGLVSGCSCGNQSGFSGYL